MKKNYHLVLLLFPLLFAGISGKTQIAYSPFVDSLSQLATHNSALLLIRQLTGDTTVIVNGESVTIQSRHYLNPSNAVAAEFIYEKFLEFGYAPDIQQFNGTRGENVIATKTGTRYPEKEFIICGHYDNMPSGSFAPGADDNASGTVAMLEAARILAPFDFDFTIRFAAWDEEETGLVGSYNYAQSASLLGHEIVGVLNLDMIAWDANNDYIYTIATNEISQAFTNDYLATTHLYQPQFTHNFYYTEASDHASFWSFGYPAILAIEDWYDFNDFYHTTNDNIQNLNMDYFVAFIRNAIANIAAQAWDQRINMQHDPIMPGNSTDPREAALIVSSNHPIANGNFAPRLYYSTNGSDFDFTLPVEIAGNTYRFMVPGFEIGTEVSYYFAVQDSMNRIIATLPSGGKGINPPGTQAPQTFFIYQVDNIITTNECSENTPIAITDFHNTYDEVEISLPGEILDLNVKLDITHSRTGELKLILNGPDLTSLMLSNLNGGEGDNYTNTIFDDAAGQSITDGTAPFTGRFRPEFPLDVFNGKPLSGTWQIRINDGGSGNTGTLDNWCLQMLYNDPDIGITETFSRRKDYLGQNFPNPASGSTSFSIYLPEGGNITLTLFNIYGQPVNELASGHFDAGNHMIVTGLKNLAPGRYFYRLETDNINETRSLVIIR